VRSPTRADRNEEPVLDVRTYRVVPGGRPEFDRLFREDALPMLRRAGIEVVGFGPSLVDDRQYLLVRAFSSTAQREQQLDHFYGSEKWLSNHSEAAMALIDSYHVVVVPLATIPRLRPESDRTDTLPPRT
jgi:hypothetical protein